MTMLEERLRALGAALEFDADDGLADTVLVDAVIARLDDQPPVTDRRPLLRIAAALVLTLALAVAAVPSSRRAVADWFGFDGVRLERRPAAPPASGPDPFDRSVVGADRSLDATASGTVVDGPTDTIGTVVEVDGTAILVSKFVGTLDNPAVGKTIGDGTSVMRVTVDGGFGLWIDGDPHQVSFLDDGEIVFERFAGNTLLWQDGLVIRRVEGFDDVAAAIQFAESLGT